MRDDAALRRAKEGSRLWKISARDGSRFSYSNQAGVVPPQSEGTRSTGLLSRVRNLFSNSQKRPLSVMSRSNQESRDSGGSRGSRGSRVSGRIWDSESSRSSRLGGTSSSSKYTPSPETPQRWSMDRERPPGDSRSSNLAHADISNSGSLPDDQRGDVRDHQSSPDPIRGEDSGHLTTAEDRPPPNEGPVRYHNLVSPPNAGYRAVSRYANLSATSERPQWPKTNVTASAATDNERAGENGSEAARQSLPVINGERSYMLPSASINADRSHSVLPNGNRSSLTRERRWPLISDTNLPPTYIEQLAMNDMSAMSAGERVSRVARQSLPVIEGDRSHSVLPNGNLPPQGQRRWHLVRDNDTPKSGCSDGTGSQSPSLPNSKESSSPFMLLNPRGTADEYPENRDDAPGAAL